MSVSTSKESKIRAIGNSAGVILPKELLEKYGFAEGDKVHLVETADGVLVTLKDPNFARAMEAYERGAKRYYNALRELAK